MSPRYKHARQSSTCLRCYFQLRTPINNPLDHPVRVLAVARRSKEERRAKGIRAQNNFCREVFETFGVTDFTWKLIFDNGVSGEKTDRPGIRRIRRGIAKGKWDIIICEDSSRLFRNMSACLRLVEEAVDAGIRVICIGDDVDTRQPDWHEKLRIAQDRHCSNNAYLRIRIDRATRYRWSIGAAVTHLRPGHRRLTSDGKIPARRRDRDPLFDEVDDLWAPVIVEAYKRVAAGDPLWTIADWLNEVGLPGCNGKSIKWTEQRVRELIQSEVYRGFEYYGKTKSVMKYTKGESEPEHNPESEWLEREVPKQRIVSDDLWYAAVDRIAARTRGGSEKGAGNKLKGIPRLSRSVTAGIFHCWCCGGKMHGDGRNEHGYRCSNARKGTCWNHATALQSLTHARLSDAIVAAMQAIDEYHEVFIGYIGGQMLRDDGLAAEEESLVKEVRRLEHEQDRLINLGEADGEDAPKAIVKAIRKVEEELARKEARLATVRDTRAKPQSTPTRDQILASIRRQTDRVLGMDRRAGVILHHLIPDGIKAVPYLLFSSTEVALRAEFTLNLVRLLPAELAQALESDTVPSVLKQLKIPMLLDLFEPGAARANAMQVYELYKFLTPKEIEKILGLTNRVVDTAQKLGQATHDAGLAQPYVRLTERPAVVARWRDKRCTSE